MNRAEFLSILRESLEGNMPKEDVEANLRYYRDYFAQSEHSDKEVCEELGDPRLIAKSLIDAYMASKGSDANQYMDQARSEYSQTYGETYGHETENGISKLFRYHRCRNCSFYDIASFFAPLCVGDLSADCIDRDCFKVDSRRFLAGNI